MDDHRFDTLTRAFAGGAPRRTFLKTIAGAVFGGAAAAKLVSDAGAACKPFGRTCAAAADCCSGACINGICKCDVGQEKCNSSGTITCVPVCPPGQYRGSACRCLCLTTGRPPVNGSCGVACAGEGQECSEAVPCCEGFTCDGICFPLQTCGEPGAECPAFGFDESCCSGCCLGGQVGCAASSTQCQV